MSIQYSDTLETFFQKSNEIEDFDSLFNSAIINHIESFLGAQKLKWADIGSGDGIKTEIMLLGFLSSGLFPDIELSIIEPDTSWGAYKFKVKGSNRVKWQSMADDLKGFIKSNKENQYNLISLVQLLYDKALADLVIDEIAKPGLQKRAVYIALENQDNIFYQIRKKLIDIMPEVLFSQMAYIESKLNEKSIPYLKETTHSKSVTIDLETDMEWFPAFVLGKSKSDYLSLPYKSRDIIENIIFTELLKQSNSQFPLNEDHLLFFI